MEPSDPVELTPTTTRVGNGASARLIALGVAGVLVAVAGYAVVSRPPPPPAQVALAPASPSLTPAPTAAPAPTPTPPRTQLEGNDGITGWPVVAQLPYFGGGLAIDPTPNYRYTATMDITGGTLRAPLARELTEVFAGDVVIESSDVGRLMFIEVGREWQQGGMTLFETFGGYDIDLKPLRKSRGGLTQLLVVHVPPDSTPAVPGPIGRGYTFTVLGRREGTKLNLFIELVWPASAQIGGRIIR